jgi:hypothetical protein
MYHKFNVTENLFFLHGALFNATEHSLYLIDGERTRAPNRLKLQPQQPLQSALYFFSGLERAARARRVQRDEKGEIRALLDQRGI